MKRHFVATTVAVCLFFASVSAAQNATFTFATLPNGTQVPASDVSTANFEPGSVLGNQFAALGVHFNNTGLLSQVGFAGSDGASTSPDGWCSTGGYTCAGNNIVVENSRSGNDPTTGIPTIDTLRITFDTPQTSVQMDIDNGYLGPSTEITAQLRSGGTLLTTLTLTQGNETSACPQSQSASQLCGRFKIGDPMLRTFDEVDILPTTIDGAIAACTITTSGFAGSVPSGVTPPPNYDANCGGSLIDNLTFSTSAAPVAVAVAGVANSGILSNPVTFCPGDNAVFDGTNSSDPLGDSLTYSWADVLDNPSLFSSTLTGVTAFLVIPNTPGVFTVQLMVTDSFNLSGKTGLLVGVESNNQAPVPQISAPGTVTSGSIVTLDGTKTYDPDHDPISYQWTQTGGPPVALVGANTAQPSFTAPTVAYPATATLTFQFAVRDNPNSLLECLGPLTSTANVNVTVEGANHAPVANAGAPQTVVSTSKVTLNGSASSDPDGDLVTYQWKQTAGTSVNLLNPTAPMPTFVAPEEPAGGQETLTFQLTVTDQPAPGYTPLSSSATVNITIQDPYAAPDCSKAVASQPALWAPDHRMVGPLSILNTTDNAPGRVTITTASVSQDEPTSGLGSGDTSPDAVINSDGTFLLRAERAGTGDGRVYHINFTASNAFGGSCSGLVTVCVPHDMGKGSTCVDEGSLYDSTR